MCGDVWKLPRAGGIQPGREDSAHGKDYGGLGVVGWLWEFQFRTLFHFDSDLDEHVDFYGTHT